MTTCARHHDPIRRLVTPPTPPESVLAHTPTRSTPVPIVFQYADDIVVHPLPPLPPPSSRRASPRAAGRTASVTRFVVKKCRSAFVGVDYIRFRRVQCTAAQVQHVIFQPIGVTGINDRHVVVKNKILFL